MSLEITEREDGTLELRPALPVPADPRWFWSERWHRREREVDAYVAAGQPTLHEDSDALLAHIDSLSEELITAAVRGLSGDVPKATGG